jgi:phosphatidylglycerol:prolipoprotein diacylglycerol transferase
MARLGERAGPWVMVLLRQLSLMKKTPDAGRSSIGYASDEFYSKPPTLPAMLVHPNFDPVAVHLGPIAIRWYGLMYLVGFGVAFWLGRLRVARSSGRVTYAILDDLLFFVVLGVVFGGRLGYVLFYKPGYYFSDPLEILAVWHGGMSFHGGFLGVLLAVWYAARKHGLRWLEVTDFVAPLIPLALAAGRMGNFINGELYGRVTDVPWGMLFHSPGAGALPRHPSQLYEFMLEGVLLFVILWVFSAKPRPVGAVSGAFLLGYGVLRFTAEFFREPDDFLGLLALGLSMGQWLSMPMIVLGLGMLVWAFNRRGKV